MKTFFLVSLVAGAGLLAACGHRGNAAPAIKPLTKQQIEQRWKMAQNPKVEERMLKKYENSLPKGGQSGLHYNPMQGIDTPNSTQSNSQKQ